MNKISETKKSGLRWEIVAVAAGAIAILAAVVLLALKPFAPRHQVIDWRDNSFTSEAASRIQAVADKAGRPGRGKLEFLSYSTRYRKDEDGKLELVTEGLLRNGYNTAIQIDELELTVKTADGETEIASAAFEGQYGTIRSKESIVWQFIFTEDFIYETDADLSRTVNHLTYRFTRK